MDFFLQNRRFFFKNLFSAYFLDFYYQKCDLKNFSSFGKKKLDQVKRSALATPKKQKENNKIKNVLVSFIFKVI